MSAGTCHLRPGEHKLRRRREEEGAAGPSLAGHSCFPTEPSGTLEQDGAAEPEDARGRAGGGILALWGFKHGNVFLFSDNFYQLLQVGQGDCRGN